MSYRQLTREQRYQISALKSSLHTQAAKSTPVGPELQDHRSLRRIQVLARGAGVDIFHGQITSSAESLQNALLWIQFRTAVKCLQLEKKLLLARMRLDFRPGQSLNVEERISATMATAGQNFELS